MPIDRSATQSIRRLLILFISISWILPFLIRFGLTLQLIPDMVPFTSQISIYGTNVTIALFIIGTSIWFTRPLARAAQDDAYLKAGFRRAQNIPNLLLLNFPITLFFLYLFNYYQFSNDAATAANFIDLSFAAVVYGLVYLFSIQKLNQYARIFPPEIFTFTPYGRRIFLGLAMVIAGLVFMTAGIYNNLEDDPQIMMIIGIFTLFVTIPGIIIASSIISTITISPMRQILKSWNVSSTSDNEKIAIPITDFGEMGAIVNKFNDAMNNLLENSRKNRRISEDLSVISEELASSVEQVNSSSQNIAATQQQIAKSSASQVTQITGIQTLMRKMVDALRAINTKNQEISQFTDLVSQIASQTNILALNAAIEAARAGEAGRGFNVVAEQVRKLANESKAAVSQSDKLLQEINNLSLSNVELVNSVSQQIDALSSSAEDNSASTEETAAAAEEQSASMEEITATAEKISMMAAELVK
jgi:methyl-accepting chemotaxis protein